MSTSPTGPTDATTAALERFIARTLERWPTLWEPWDPAWRSPCETGDPVDGLVPWRPLRRDPPGDDLRGLEQALETTLHPSIHAWFGAFWSGGLEAEAPDGHVSLILLWNDEDAERLLGNLVGHAMAKQRARDPLTVFFACTEPDAEEFLSIDNATGEVLLERPGARPLRTVAPSLAAFIDTLEPADPACHPERTVPTDDRPGGLLA